MQPSGGVGEHDVGSVLGSARNRVEDDTRRIGAGFSANELAAGALGPDAELLDRRRSKVSPAANITFLPLSRSFAATLPIVVVLPTPLTPTKRITCGVVPQANGSAAAAGRRQRFAQPRL